MSSLNFSISCICEQNIIIYDYNYVTITDETHKTHTYYELWKVKTICSYNDFLVIKIQWKPCNN